MKSLITRVLLATDFSPCAARALEYALAVTSSWKAELHVLHVLEFYPGMDPEYPVNQIYLDELRKDADRQFITLDKYAAESGISIWKRIEFGIPSQRIETVATEQQVDLIILGMHGRTVLQHVLVGSTAERVVRTGPCPVLSINTGRIPVSRPATDAADRPVVISPHIGTHRFLRMFSRCAGVCNPVCKAHGSIGDHSSHTGTGALQPGFHLISFSRSKRKEGVSARQARSIMRNVDVEPYQS